MRSSPRSLAFLLLALVLLGAGCTYDLPRFDNPADPLSPSFESEDSGGQEQEDDGTDDSLDLHTTDDANPLAVSSTTYDQADLPVLQSASYDQRWVTATTGLVVFQRAMDTIGGPYYGYAKIRIVEVNDGSVRLDFTYYDSGGTPTSYSDTLLYYHGSGTDEYLELETGELTSTSNRTFGEELELVRLSE